MTAALLTVRPDEGAVAQTVEPPMALPPFYASLQLTF